MNETQVKFTDELAEKIKSFFATPEFAKSMKDLQDGVDAGDTGTFRMVISTDNEDRHGEVIDQNGWEFENYMRNPVVLWGHNHFEIPVGATDKLYIELDETGVYRRTIAEGRFASHEFAQTLRKLYDEKMLRTSSVGFLPKEYNGNRIIKAELLEWSFVSIPANQFAVSLNEIAGYSRELLLEKGILAKDVKEGDTVETPAEDAKPKEEEEKPAEEIAASTETEVVAPADEKKEDEPTAADLEAIEEEAEEAEDAVINEDEKTLTVKTGKKSFKFKMTDAFVTGFKTMIELKAGRVISAKNLSKIKDAHTALQEVIDIAETSSEEEGKQVDTAPKGGDVKSAETKEAEEFLALRKDMQAIAKAVGDALGEMRPIAEKYIRNLKSS